MRLDRKNLFFGAILIMIGILVALVTLRVVPTIGMLYVPAGCFLAAYIVFHRNIGFLIPGCVLAAVATFVTLQQENEINSIFMVLFLGIAFLAVFFIHTMHLKTFYWGERNWPLFPGVILIVIATLVLNSQREWLGLDRKVFNMIIPVLLIAVGIILLFGERKKPS
jgi:hypothetical protein